MIKITDISQNLFTQNIDSIIKVLISILTALIIAIVTKFIIKKFNVNEFLINCLYPRPIFGDFLTKMINIIIRDELIDGILKLKSTIQTRFGKIGTIPIVLDITDIIQIKSIGTNPIFFKNKEIGWCVNNKMAIVFINRDNLKKIVPMLHQMFEGVGFQCISIHFSVEDTTITSICDFIFSVTKTIIPVILIKDLDYIYLQSFVDIYQTNECIGIEINKADEFISTYQNFIHDNITRSVNSRQNLNRIFPKDVKYLYAIENTISNHINQVSNSEMKIRGIYFICYNKIGLKEQVLFLEDLYLINIYSLCDECQILDKFVNERKFNIVRWISILITIISVIVGFFMFRSINHRIKSIQMSAYISDSIINSKVVDDIKILNYIKMNNVDNIGFVSKIFASKDVYRIKYIRNFLITNSTRVFDKIDNIDTEDIFSFTPIETKAFRKLETNIQTLGEALTSIASFVNSEDNYHAIDEKISNYTNICKTKIISNFNDFLLYFKKYILFTKITFLRESIDDMFQKPTIEKIETVLEEMRKVKAIARLATNNWWITGNLGGVYDNVKKNLKQIPKVGNDLITEIDFMTDTALQQIKNDILSMEVPFIGKLFTIQNNNLEFSPKAESLFYHCEFLIQEPLIQIPIGIMQYAVPEKDEISLWDLDILDKILEKIELREEFLKSIVTYPTEVKKISILMVNNRLYDYIKSSLCQSQKLILNSLPIEKKAKNIGNALEKLNKIQQFIVKTLSKTMPTFVDFLVSDSILKICDEFRLLLDNSVFTAYTRLAKWKGEELVPFLFQCRNEDLPFITSKTISMLQFLNENVITHIIGKLPEISQQEYRFIKYIYKEVSAYVNGQKSYISVFENYINDLPNWGIKYRSSDIKISSKEDFFAFHEKTFRRSLILQTNKLFLEQSKQYYNEIVKFFKEHLAGRFPFGNGEAANSMDVIKFIKMYKQCRDHLKSDVQFNNLKLDVSLKYLDDLCNFFIIENDILFINAKIQYHLPEGKNIYLIKNYYSKFGDEVIIGDTVDYKTRAAHGFSFGVEIINSSKMKILTKREDLSNVFGTRIKFQFLEEYGFLRFCKAFFSMTKDTELTIKIGIPIESDDRKTSDEIVCFIKILDYPFFFSDMSYV